MKIDTNMYNLVIVDLVRLVIRAISLGIALIFLLRH
jgi:hypothetical protein